MTRGHGGFGHGRGHGIAHHNHGIGNRSFGSHHHHSGGGGNQGLLTDQNWENKEPAANGKWQGEFFAGCCYSPNDWIFTCYFPCCYNCLLANDIGLKLYY